MTGFDTEFDSYYDRALDLLKRSGSTTEVYEYIQTIEDEDYRSRTFDRVAQFLVGQGNLAEALRYSSAIVRPLEQVDALYEVGRLLRRNGDRDSARGVFGRALEAATRIEVDHDKATRLVQIAEQLERIGENDEAMALANRAVELAKPSPQDFEAAKTLRSCARLLSKWRHMPEALTVAQAIDNRWSDLRQTTLEEVQGRGQWPVRPEENTEEDI